MTISSGNGSGAVVLTGTLTQIDSLLTGTSAGTIDYINASDTPVSSTTVAVTVNDGGNTGSDPGGDPGSEEDSASQTINITAVNDTPVVTAPASAYTVDEQTSLALQNTGFTVSDADAGSGPVTATLAVGEGQINIAEGNSGVVISGGNGSSSVELTGTLTQIDNLLTGISDGTIDYINNSDTPSAVLTNMTVE